MGTRSETGWHEHHSAAFFQPLEFHLEPLDLLFEVLDLLLQHFNVAPEVFHLGVAAGDFNGDGISDMVFFNPETGDWYALPGGGQEPEETLADCVARECREELGVDVRVGALLFVRDHIVANHDFSYVDEAPHQLEHLFLLRGAGRGNEERQLRIRGDVRRRGGFTHDPLPLAPGLCPFYAEQASDLVPG